MQNTSKNDMLKYARVISYYKNGYSKFLIKIKMGLDLEEVNDYINHYEGKNKNQALYAWFFKLKQCSFYKKVCVKL